MKILLMIFASYLVTNILVQATILDKPRFIFMKYTWFLATKSGGHILNCRFCTGFWVSAGIVIYYQQIEMFPLVAGASYFLVKQERK